MINFNKSVAAIAVAASLGLSGAALAGNNDGSLSGSVLTSSDTALANATITVRNTKTGFSRTIQADAEGKYRFSKLPVGLYKLTASKDGYETSTLEKYSVNIGSNSVDVRLSETGMERIAVSGTSMAGFDVTSSEAGLNISEIEIDRIPVPRDVTSVALLAPGTTKGDDRFGNYASFGGASIAENSMYINGLNVTNFRNGVGFSSVPFEFYKEFQVKTGGYSAEFGRSTGGVVNAVTKSGSNDFEFGGSIFYRPESMRQTAPSSNKVNGDPSRVNNFDSQDELDGNIYASGAIIQDTIFFYALYNPKSYDKVDTLGDGGTYRGRKEENSFWGVKLDWHMGENHMLEYLAFSDSNDVVDDNYNFDTSTGQTVGQRNSVSTEKEGGDNFSLKYTGYITDDFTISALYGENEYELTTLADNQETCNMVLDLRANKPQGYDIGCAGLNDYFVEVGKDKREAFRVDFEWALGDHTLRFGLDHETNTSFSQQKYSGSGDGAYWLIYDGTPGSEIQPGIFVPEGSNYYARDRIRTVGGAFETIASAMYFEDIWAVTDNLTLTLGLRLETFDNKNSNGDTFVKIDDMLAPRIGASWDINGDGESKLYGSYGTYYLPVANNTNVRLSGNEFDVRTYYTLSTENGGLQSNTTESGNTYYTPALGSSFGQTQNANGEVPDVTVIVDQDLDPMYQDEFIIGYQRMVSDDMNIGVRAIRRELNGAIDDMLIDHYTNATYGCGHIDHAYVLGNPGEDMTVDIDTDCDGVGDGLKTIPGADLGYPTAERKYNAVEFTFERAWDDVWSVQGSYTWSHSYGNSEGLVKSDNGQDDAGITTDFDFVELTDGAYGNLANDRRHMFKIFGAYALTENLRLSANLSMYSGRPRNAFGVSHPNAGTTGWGGQVDYGQTYYSCISTCNGPSQTEYQATGEMDAAGNPTYVEVELNTNLNADGAPQFPIIYADGSQAVPEYKFNPRGSAGRTDWITRLDLSLTYDMEVGGSDITLRADVFNVLSNDGVTYYNEDIEENIGEYDLSYGAPDAWQTPRYVQFSASFKF